MTDLALILISGDELKENLRRSLDESERHPWGFSEWKRQMQGLRSGVEVAFVELTDESGRPVNRFTSSTAALTARRLVLGELDQAIGWEADPYFTGFPFEFWFVDGADTSLDPPLPLEDLAVRLNEQLDELRIESVQLTELIRHAKSNRVGLFVDGAPRKAEYFPDGGKPGPSLTQPSSEGDDVVGSSPEEPSVEKSRFGLAVESFAQAVEDAGIIFGGANSSLPVAFLAAVAAKRFVILSGLSGSGKTLIARALGQWISVDSIGARYLVVPVRPDWTSPEPLLGYEDVLLPPVGGRRAWDAPRAVQFMLRAAEDPEHLYLLVLDEMNLAHVERYFADVLSGMESGEPVVPALVAEADGHWRVRLDGPPTIPVPANLLIVGTVNIDETTYQFSPKVLDRAFTFDFRVQTSELTSVGAAPTAVAAAEPSALDAVAAAFRDRTWHLDNPADHADELVEQLIDLHRRLAEIGFEFGHRVFGECIRFASMLSAAGVSDEDAVLDWVLMTKILPRLHGARRQLEPFLEDLLALATGADAEKPVMPRTARKADRMLDLVRVNQFVSFAE